MALLNIGASNKDDAFYRYKMPRLVTKIEGRGNGIKTNLVNMVDVAKALARPPSYTTKFFGCELGAQSKFDEKSATAIVNGAHDATKLAALLETFIKKYVQCYGCGNPETEIVITKSQLISLKCAACGFVSNVDMRDKLTTFILKNPPEQKKGASKKGMRRAEKERLKEGEALDEEIKQSKKGSKKKKGHDDDSNANRKKASGSDEEEHSSATSQTDQVDAPQNVDGDNDDEVEWLTDTSFQAAQQRIQEQLTVATSEMVVLNTGSEEQESNGKTVTSKGSLKKEADEESGVRSVNETTVHVKLVRDFKECLERGYNAHQLGAHLWIDRPNVSQQEAVNAYFEALFAETIKGVGKEAAKKKSYLTTVKDNAQGQELLLGAVEAYFVGGPAERRKEVEVAGLLKILYDTDVLEEEPILAWYDVGAEHGFKSEADQVKKLATRFVDWLRNAESEDED